MVEKEVLEKRMWARRCFLVVVKCFKIDLPMDLDDVIESI